MLTYIAQSNCSLSSYDLDDVICEARLVVCASNKSQGRVQLITIAS